MPINRITIKEHGLQGYLDDPAKVAKHGGNDYAKLVAMIENHATKTAIMREFNVASMNTVTAWIQIYKAGK